VEGRKKICLFFIFLLSDEGGGGVILFEKRRGGKKREFFSTILSRRGGRGEMQIRELTNWPLREGGKKDSYASLFSREGKEVLRRMTLGRRRKKNAVVFKHPLLIGNRKKDFVEKRSTRKKGEKGKGAYGTTAS